MEPWQHELTQAIRTLDQLEAHVPLPHRESLRAALKNMRLAITPHTARLIDFTDPQDPLFLLTVPQAQELTIAPEELADPIGDEAKSPVPFLTHRYPDRVLVYVTFFCSSYCRFCFRRFKTGQATPGPTAQDRERVCAYLRAHPEVDEVILTGGDPLTLVDAQLEEWLTALRGIPTMTRIRIHTRVPVNLPARITPGLISLLRAAMDATHPVYVVTHFNHPRELAPENIAALAALVDAGIVVRNQAVLLRGVNDDIATLRAIFKRLTDVRVVPYYLHQLDLARGTGHFRVPLETGMALMQALQGTTTGIALPRYMLDLPGGHGKVPLGNPWLVRQDDGSFHADSPLGGTVAYREPIERSLV